MGKKSSFIVTMNAYLPHSRKELFSVAYGAVATAALFLLYFQMSATFFSNHTTANVHLKGTDRFHSTPIPMEEFPEPAWRTPGTLAVKTVASTPFARFEIHKVKTESGAIIDDWLWTDERSHVNILVHLKAENKYLLFHQKKYGLEKAYLAAVGGLFEIGDTPDGCAKRELLEETGLIAEEMVSLGRYRVQVNRGGGLLYAYLAKNCIPAKQSEKAKNFEQDYEKQERRLLTRDQLIRAALAGEIGEAQWLATIALGIVHEEHT